MNEERMIEERMRAAGKLLADEWADALPDGPGEGEQPHVWSRRFLSRMTRLYRDAAKGPVPYVRKHRILRTVLAVAAAVVLLTVTAIAAGPGRGAFARVFVKEDSSKRLEFSFVENEEKEDAVPPVSDRPTWMPAQFYVLKEEVCLDLVHLSYAADDRQGLFYYERWDRQEGVDTVGNVQFSSSELDIRHEMVYIGPYEGMLVYIVNDEKGTNTGEITYDLFWADPDYTYHIQTWIASKEEVIRAAQSIYGTP